MVTRGGEYTKIKKCALMPPEEGFSAPAGAPLHFKVMLVFEDFLPKSTRTPVDIYVDGEKVKTIYVYAEEGDIIASERFSLVFTRAGRHGVRACSPDYV